MKKCIRIRLYNCLSLLQFGRAEEIYKEVNSSATLLTGAKIKALTDRKYRVGRWRAMAL